MNTDKLSLAVPTFSYYYFAVVLFAIFSPIQRNPIHVVDPLFIVRVLSLGVLIQGSETSLTQLLFDSARPSLLAHVIMFLTMAL